MASSSKPRRHAVALGTRNQADFEESAAVWNALGARLPADFPDVSLSAVQVVLTAVVSGQRIESAASTWLAPSGLTPPRFNALMAIWLAEPEPISLSQVGRRMVTTRSNVTGVIDALERTKLVHRTPHPLDRRSTLLTLTERGRAQLQGILPVHFAALMQLAGRLSINEQRQLIRLLDRLCSELPNPN